MSTLVPSPAGSSNPATSPTARWLAAAGDDRDQRVVPVVLACAWGAIFVNVLAFAGNPTIISVPRPAGQAVTQAALLLAFGLALIANRRRLVRPLLFLVLLTMLAVACLMVAPHSEYPKGSTFRACRLFGFVLVLWLLSPWFGRRDMVLLRCHLICLRVVLASVVIGAALSPGLAFAFDGRLAGVLWPIPSTQVAHYAAVLLGATLVLWLSHVVSGRHTLITLVVVTPILLATHTRTALLAAVVALTIAGASLFLGHARVRRTSALGAIGAMLAATVFASHVTTWLLRGQTVQDADQFTGRTKVWTQVVSLHRAPIQEMFGNGLSNMSFNGLPIDSNWVATYLDEGWFGIVVEASILLLLLGMAITHVRGPRRAVALFLIVYCLIASITETGLSNASPYVLDLAVAAALLASEPTQVIRWRSTRSRS